MRKKGAYIEDTKLSKKEEIKVRSGCVWTLIYNGHPKDDIDNLCKSYGITKEQASKWRDFWMSKLSK